MSNRYLRQFQYTMEADTVSLYGSFNVGSSGAVASFAGGGIASVVKESTAGQYTITLTDKYSRFLEFAAMQCDDAVSQVASIQLLEDPATLQSSIKSGGAFTIQCLAIESDATPQLIAANPADGALVMFKVVMRNSSVGPFDE